MTDDSDRALALFFERWLEQLQTTFVPRRARTLSTFAALDELIGLAESHVRLGGQTRPAPDPLDAGHGVHMLPDVADEVGVMLSADEVLRRRYAARKEILQDLASKFKSRENVSQEAVEQLRSVLTVLRKTCTPDAFAVLSELVDSTPKAHAAVFAIADTLVSELRVRGWSDEGLVDAVTHARQTEGATKGGIAKLEQIVSKSAAQYECYVSVSVPQKRLPFPDDPSFTLVDEVPPTSKARRPMKGGPYIRATIEAFDPAAAAASAYRRCSSTLGALRVFLPGSQLDVSSEVVGVQLVDGLRSFEVQERLIEENRSARPEEAKRILASSWKVNAQRAADPLHDAIRLRHRALLASDPESRLLLLWSGMERMTAGARGFDGALTAARELVSHAVTFGKLRRDVGDLAACVAHTVSKDEDRKNKLIRLTRSPSAPTPHVDRSRFLEYLMSPEDKLRELTGIFYDMSPLLAYRCHELWTELGGGVIEQAGERLTGYHERSRARVSRQVARIYRARNRVAHVGSGPDRVRDLVWHAHFYLTQLTAICVHYGERDQKRAQDILVHRLGQYRALIKLLKGGDPTLLTPKNLLRPSNVVS